MSKKLTIFTLTYQAFFFGKGLFSWAKILHPNHSLQTTPNPLASIAKPLNVHTTNILFCVDIFYHSLYVTRLTTENRNKTYVKSCQFTKKLIGS